MKSLHPHHLCIFPIVNLGEELTVSCGPEGHHPLFLLLLQDPFRCPNKMHISTLPPPKVFSF